MGCCKIYGIAFILLFTLNTCEERSRPSEFSQRRERFEIEIIVDGEYKGKIDEEVFQSLRRVEWQTGLSDIQRGYCLDELFSKIGIKGIERVKVYSYGRKAKELLWSQIANCSLLISVTHRGTFKLIGKGRTLRRKKWLKHIFKIEIETK